MTLDNTEQILYRRKQVFNTTKRILALAESKYALNFNPKDVKIRFTYDGSMNGRCFFKHNDLMINYNGDTLDRETEWSEAFSTTILQLVANIVCITAAKWSPTYDINQGKRWEQVYMSLQDCVKQS